MAERLAAAAMTRNRAIRAVTKAHRSLTCVTAMHIVCCFPMTLVTVGAVQPCSWVQMPREESCHAPFVRADS